MWRPLAFLLLLPLSSSAQEWAEIIPSSPTSPPPRTNAAAVFVNVNQSMIIFGGRGAGGDFNDLWAFDLNSETWSELTPSQGAQPLPRRTPNTLYDASSNALLMWSGQNGSTTLNDIWAFDLDQNMWTEFDPPAPEPNMRYGAASIFDPRTMELVTFAGFTSEGRFNDTWRFNPQQNQWTNVTPAGTLPRMRCLHSASYDSLNHRMITYGGQNGGALDDIWSFDLSNHNWTELTPQERPNGRWFSTNIYDADNHRVVIFGGNLGGLKSDEVWAFDLTTEAWQQITPAGGSPTARDGATAIYVPSNFAMIMFGGQDQSGNYSDDVWSLSLSEPVSVRGPDNSNLPEQFRVLGNYPNPFNPSTVIVFDLPRQMRVALSIYNIQGRLVKTLFTGGLDAGRHEIRWDGKIATGALANSGLYIYQFVGPGLSASGTMLLLK